MLNECLPVAEMATGEMVRGRGFADHSPTKGLVHYELLRGGRILVPRTLAHNGVTNSAKNAFLDAWFNAGSRPGASAWVIGLVDGPTYTTFQPSDTMDGHPGWTEFTNYTYSGSGSLRGTWGKGAASGQLVTNSTAIAYDFVSITGSTTIQGIFVTTDSTKGGNVGTLWSTASFLTPLAVQTGDQLRVTYTVQL